MKPTVKLTPRQYKTTLLAVSEAVKRYEELVDGMRVDAFNNPQERCLVQTWRKTLRKFEVLQNELRGMA